MIDEIKFFALSEKGEKNEHNEDAFFIPEKTDKDLLKANGYLFVVCDGVGGHQAGEIASRFCTEWLQHTFYNFEIKGKIITFLDESIRNINRRMYHLSGRNSTYRGMATTLVNLLIKDGKAYFNSVGDSRIYLFEKDDNFRNDKRILKFIFSELLFNCKELYTTLEEESIFWINDIDFILTKLTHTVDNIKNHQPDSLVFPGKFKQPEDKEFVINLLRNTLIHTEEYTKIIENNIVNWDIDRVADFEKIVMMTAVSEIIKFPSIPVNVTFNEYIELAKLFGTDKSGSFINGILDKIIGYLKKEELFIKTGRGLADK